MGKTKRSRKAKAVREPTPVGTCKEYDVEVIVAVKPIPNTNCKRFEYLVQWAGYPGEDTWEPLENIVAGCHRLLMSLWRELGTFDPTSKGKSGIILQPSKEWIDAEVHYFRKMCTELEHETWHHQPAIGYNEETGQMNRYD